MPAEQHDYRTGYYKLTNSLVTVLFLALSVLLLTLAMRTYDGADETARIRQEGTGVIGRVTAIRELADAENTYGNTTHALTYEYRVGGRYYSADALFPAPPDYQVGDSLQVWYLPADPAEARNDLQGQVSMDGTRQGTMILAGAIGCLVIAIGFALHHGLLRRRQADPAGETEPTADAAPTKGD